MEPWNHYVPSNWWSDWYPKMTHKSDTLSNSPLPSSTPGNLQRLGNWSASQDKTLSHFQNPNFWNIKNYPLLQYKFVSPENEFNGAQMCGDTDILQTWRHSWHRSHGTTQMVQMVQIASWHVCVEILRAIRHEGRNSCLSHYHETSGLAQTHEESVDTNKCAYTKSQHCHTNTCEALALNLRISNNSSNLSSSSINATSWHCMNKSLLKSQRGLMVDWPKILDNTT